MDIESTAEVRAFVRKTQKSAIISGLMVSLALSLLWSRFVGLGFMAGVAISIINFQLMSVDAYDIVGKLPKKARKFIIGRYAVRFAIMFGFLALIATRTDLNILSAFIGIFFVQALLFIGEVRKALDVNGGMFKGLKG